MAARWQRIAVDLTRTKKKYNPGERKAIAEGIIDFMTKRTLEGKDVTGKRFSRTEKGRYTKAYAKSKGVSRSSVDLVKTFDMLPHMHLISERSGKLLIGFEKGSEQNAKADGNQRGTYGRPSPIPGKARPFLGIKEKEVEAVIKKLRLEQKERIRREVPARVAQEVLEGIS